MVKAKLHCICGNCGCNDMWEYQIKHNECYLICNNCGTVHTLDETGAVCYDKKPMNKEISINLNKDVKIYLSEIGLDMYKEKMKEFNAQCTSTKLPLFPKRDDDGFVHAQLWSVISDYGSQIGLGLESPFADNCIHVELED